MLALWACSPSAAQTVYGSIVGRVSDISGAVIKDASVTVIDQGTGESRSSATNSEGDYGFVNLVPGKYRMDIKAARFKLFSRNTIDVRVDSVARIDAALAVGGANESIEVKEQTPLLDTQDSSVGQVIEGRQVLETPLNGRNVMNLLALVPGVIPREGHKEVRPVTTLRPATLRMLLDSETIRSLVASRARTPFFLMDRP
jgi:hypothetical protein